MQGGFFILHLSSTKETFNSSFIKRKNQLVNCNLCSYKKLNRDLNYIRFSYKWVK